MNGFCGHCGNKVETHASYCSQCGAPVTSAKNQTPKKKFCFAISITALALTVLLICLITISDNYESAVRTYEKVLNGDYDKIKQLAPDAFWNKNGESTLIDYKDSRIDNMNRAREEFGSDAKFALEILNAAKIDLDEISKQTFGWERRFSADQRDIEEAYQITLKISVGGRGDMESSTRELLSIRIGEQWYLSETDIITFLVI